MIGPTIDKFLLQERRNLVSASSFLLHQPQMIVNSIYSRFQYLQNLPQKFDGSGMLKGIFGARPAPVGSPKLAAPKVAKAHNANRRRA